MHLQISTIVSTAHWFKKWLSSVCSAIMNPVIKIFYCHYLVGSNNVISTAMRGRFKFLIMLTHISDGPGWHQRNKIMFTFLKELYDYMVTSWKWNSYFRWHLTLSHSIRYWAFNTVFQTYNIFWSVYEYISVGLIELLWNVSKCWLRIQRNENLFCHVSPSNERH